MFEELLEMEEGSPEFIAKIEELRAEILRQEEQIKRCKRLLSRAMEHFDLVLIDSNIIHKKNTNNEKFRIDLN